MKFVALHANTAVQKEEKGIEQERIRLSESAGFEPLTKRFEANWQNDNNCVEVFLLNEVIDNAPGTERGHTNGGK